VLLTTDARRTDGYGEFALTASHRRIAHQRGSQHLELALDHHSSARRSPLDRPPSGRRNPDSDNLDRPLTRHHVALCDCKPGADELSQDVAAEDMAMNELLLVDAKPAAGEQL
jgi:uncharacterized protein (DUF58 family)